MVVKSPPTTYVAFKFVKNKNVKKRPINLNFNDLKPMLIEGAKISNGLTLNRIDDMEGCMKYDSVLMGSNCKNKT